MSGEHQHIVDSRDLAEAYLAEHPADDSERDSAIKSVGRLQSWIRDYGHEKEPRFLSDLEAVLAVACRALSVPLTEDMGGQSQGTGTEGE